MQLNEKSNIVDRHEGSDIRGCLVSILIGVIAFWTVVVVLVLYTTDVDADEPEHYDTVKTDAWTIECYMQDGEKKAVYFDNTRIIDPQVSTPQSVRVFIAACPDPYRQPCGVCHG